LEAPERDLGLPAFWRPSTLLGERLPRYSSLLKELRDERLEINKLESRRAIGRASEGLVQPDALPTSVIRDKDYRSLLDAVFIKVLQGTPMHRALSELPVWKPPRATENDYPPPPPPPPPMVREDALSDEGCIWEFYCHLKMVGKTPRSLTLCNRYGTGMAWPRCHPGWVCTKTPGNPVIKHLDYVIPGTHMITAPTGRELTRQLALKGLVTDPGVVDEILDLAAHNMGGELDWVKILGD